MEPFPQFNDFPPEIHAMILTAAHPNDTTCMRLTCKYLYNLLPQPPTTNLHTTSTPTLCLKPSLTSSSTWSDRYQHRQNCHQQSWEHHCALLKKQGKPEPELKRCRTKRWNVHCECFVMRTRLHYRLSKWMGKGFNYCGICKKFTKRKRGHNGRCYHGRGKPPKRQETFWTHHSRRGGFGRKLWKKWFNNQAMNRFEAKLRTGRSLRGGFFPDRYEFRSLEGKNVDTRPSRSVDPRWDVYGYLAENLKSSGDADPCGRLDSIYS